MTKTGLKIPWERYALITKLAIMLHKQNPQFGKTALQKMIYLLQELYKIDCGYNFDLYTYGPFNAQLLDDLDSTEHLGGVKVNRIDTSYGGYEIIPGDKADYILKKGEKFINTSHTSDKISQLITDFGNFKAADLELRSTLIYVDHDLKRYYSQPTQPELDEIIKVVKDIKPKFSLEKIQEVGQELKENSFICQEH